MGIFRDTAAEGRYFEVFLVQSWAEHLRQHERLTQAVTPPAIQLQPRFRPGSVAEVSF
jgi:hypothetical protein